LKQINFNITFLGTSAASISPYSSTSASLVEINQNWILIDAGIGALRQLRKVKVSPENINIILITHWHPDHYAGLPAVLRAKRTSSNLSIYGPAIPFAARLYLTALFYPLNRIFKTVTGDFSQIYSDFCLQAIPTSHNIDSYGWAIIEKTSNQPQEGRKIIITGDTQPNENIVHAAKKSDLLVHEATYLSKDAKLAHLHHHSTVADAAEIALKSGVGALALNHVPDRYSTQKIQAEAQKIFPRVLVPSPLDKIYVDPLPNNELKEKPGWAKIRIEEAIPPLP
jgi:ribonuclease Z